MVAVSGGLDSMVLLDLLQRLASEQRWRLTVAHLNHQLRGRSSDADERLVRRTAARLKLPVVVERADVRRFAREQKLSIEMAARAVRHGFLARVARRRRAMVVALAHHADDQTELFFLRLLRGSGAEGLSGMKWRGTSPADAAIKMVRPLLDQPKAALLVYAAERGIKYREDASNALLDMQRNRVRHELLPLLRGKYQPALDKTVLRVMEIVGAETAVVGEWAARWLQARRKAELVRLRASGEKGARSESARFERVNLGGGTSNIQHPAANSQEGCAGAALDVGCWLLDVGCSAGAERKPGRTRTGTVSSEFADLPIAVQRQCLRLQLRALGFEPDYDTVERLRNAAGRPVVFGPGRAALRDTNGLVRLQQEQVTTFSSEFVAIELKDRGGRADFNGIALRWRIGKRAPVALRGSGSSQECFDADRVGSQVILRHWRPGDRFQPIGMRVAVKLQDFFVNQKVPRHIRRSLVLATTTEGEVFWVQGMRISERFKLTSGTNRILHWRWKSV